jgi:hypothetical protein
MNATHFLSLPPSITYGCTLWVVNRHVTFAAQHSQILWIVIRLSARSPIAVLVVDVKLPAPAFQRLRVRQAADFTRAIDDADLSSEAKTLASAVLLDAPPLDVFLFEHAVVAGIAHPQGLDGRYAALYAFVKLAGQIRFPSLPYPPEPPRITDFAQAASNVAPVD